MTSLMHRTTFTACAAALTFAGIAVPAVAQAAPDTKPPADGVASHAFKGQENAAAYWTPERMKKAKDRSKELPAHARPGKPEKPGRPSTVQGQEPVLNAVRETPKSTIGKVFFTLNGTDYVCSANSVRAGNRSVVATAGHCVNEGPGAYASRFIFVPAYENGRAPYGRWTGVRAFTPTEWASSGDMNQDMAFVVVGRLGGYALADRVGATGIAFNQPRGLTYTSFGYPAAHPFDGETLQSCYGKAFTNPVDSRSLSQGIPCDMTGGSSGGPWFIGSGYSAYSSVQNSVNSFGYPSLGDYMFGPYFGTKAQQSYNSAQYASTY